MVDESLTGRLLVAAPALDDPNFFRVVLLVIDHDEDGAIGVVLNRASGVPVGETIAGWGALAAEPAVVFGGEPVEPTAVVALGRASVDGDRDLLTDRLARIRLVDLDQDPVLAGVDLDDVRIFAGYAGWGPGQLEGELTQGAWFPVEAEPGDVFTEDPSGLWRQVLRRQPNPLRLLATFPDDPTTN